MAIDLKELKLPDQKTDLSNMSLPNPLKGLSLPKEGPALPNVEAPKIEPVISTNELTQPKAPITPTFNREAVRTNIQKTFDEAPTAKLNQQGLDGLLKMAGQQAGSNAELLGRPLNEAINALGLGGEFTGTKSVVDIPETPLTSAEQRSQFFSDAAKEKELVEANKTTGEKLDDFVTEYTNAEAENKERVTGEVGLETKANALTLADGEIAAIDEKIDNYNVGLIRQGVDIKARPVLMGDINQALARLDDNSKLDLLLLTTQKNTAIANYNVKLGDYNRASEIVAESSETYKEAKQSALDRFAIVNDLNNDERVALQQELDNEVTLRGLGYVPLNEEDTAQAEADILAGKTDNTIFTNPTNGKKYLVPAQVSVEGVDDFEFIKGTEDQSGGVFNKTTGKFTTFDGVAGAGTVLTASGEAYDIGSYATDPNHETAVQGMLQKMGKFNSIAEMDSYIQSVAPGSPVTGQMIANSATKHGVSWEMMTAIMQQDSSLGTAGIGARNNNPGNIAQFDSLGTTPTAGYATMQEGVDAVAKNLAWRKLGQQELDTEVSGFVKQVQDGGLTTAQALDKISKTKRADLIDALSKVASPQDTKDDTMAKEKMANALALKDHKGLNSVVGPTALARIDIFDRFGAKQDFIGKVDQIVSDLSLQALIDAKSRGATFGALSDTEMKILSSAATKIGTWQEKDKEGNTVRYNVSEKMFKEELDNIAKIFDRAIKGSIEDEANIPANAQRMPDGTAWVENADGSFTQVN